MTEGPGEIFPRLPNLRAFVRCAVDIRNIDVDAASAAGVLVTRAGPGFIQSVARDGARLHGRSARGVSRATRRLPCRPRAEIRMGRQLAGAEVGIVGYGASRATSPPSPGARHAVLVADPFATVSDPHRACAARRAARRSDFVVCLAVANDADREPVRRRRRWRGCSRMRSSSICRAAISSTRPRSRALARQPHRRRGDGCRPRARPDAVARAGKLANVIATPHTGGLRRRRSSHQSLETVRQVEAIIAGEVPVRRQRDAGRVGRELGHEQ